MERLTGEIHNPSRVVFLPTQARLVGIETSLHRCIARMLVGLETAPAGVILVETSSVVFDLESRLEPVGVVCPDVY
jgi:hypothetical protein